jgi:hypothetical protein
MSQPTTQGSWVRWIEVCLMMPLPPFPKWLPPPLPECSPCSPASPSKATQPPFPWPPPPSNACPPPQMLAPYFRRPTLRACPSLLFPHSCGTPCCSCRIRPDNLCAIIDHDNERLSRLGKRDSGAHIGHGDRRPASIADRKERGGSQHRSRG